MKIVAIKDASDGVETWKEPRVFSESDTLKDIMNWAAYSDDVLVNISLARVKNND